MFLEMPVLESKTITLRTENHQTQNPCITAGDKMPDPHTKHLCKIISPTQQRIQWNKSHITGAKHNAQELNYLRQSVSTFIPPHTSLNIKYLILTEGQLPTPPSAMFSLGSKKPGCNRKREDTKMSFFTVFFIEIFSFFAVFYFQHMKTNKTGGILWSTAKGVTNTGTTAGKPWLLLHIHHKHWSHGESAH